MRTHTVHDEVHQEPIEPPSWEAFAQVAAALVASADAGPTYFLKVVPPNVGGLRIPPERLAAAFRGVAARYSRLLGRVVRSEAEEFDEPRAEGVVTPLELAQVGVRRRE